MPATITAADFDAIASDALAGVRLDREGDEACCDFCGGGLLQLPEEIRLPDGRRIGWLHGAPTYEDDDVCTNPAPSLCCWGDPGDCDEPRSPYDDQYCRAHA